LIELTRAKIRVRKKEKGGRRKIEERANTRKLAKSIGLIFLAHHHLP
jgi:hypothetical protein